MSPHPDLPSFAVIGPEPSALFAADVRAGTSWADEWRIVAENLDLTVAPEPLEGESNPGEQGAFDQLVAVRGQLRGERPREVDSRGSRSERAGGLEPGRFLLVRDVAAWFGPGQGFALIAVRPRRASGHGEERVSATAFSAGHQLPVADPRLSTTYGESSEPVRATLEMWFAEDEQTGAQDAVLYPRRAAGEASTAATKHEVDHLAVHVQPFSWRAEGRDGAGVYLLARAR
jgi:hypothetical protein